MEQVAEDVGASAPRVARWHSIFLSGGRDAIAKSEFEAHRTQGFFERHRTAVFQWTVVTLTLLVALAVLTHFATTALP